MMIFWTKKTKKPVMVIPKIREMAAIDLGQRAANMPLNSVKNLGD